MVHGFFSGSQWVQIGLPEDQYGLRWSLILDSLEWSEVVHIGLVARVNPGVLRRSEMILSVLRWSRWFLKLSYMVQVVPHDMDGTEWRRWSMMVQYVPRMSMVIPNKWSMMVPNGVDGPTPCHYCQRWSKMIIVA